MKTISSIKEGLFLLVKSLEKAEKRNFKLFVKKQNRMEDSNSYLQLFNLINEQSVYNEQIIKDKLGFDDRKLACIKYLLYELILKSLRHLYSKYNSNFEIRTLLDKVEILYNKKLYLQSYKVLIKVKKIVFANEKYTYMPELMRLTKMLSEVGAENIITSNFIKECREKTIEVSKEFEIVELLSTFRVIKQRMYTAITKEEYIVLNKAMNNPTLKMLSDELTFKGQLAYNEIYAIYNYLIGNEDAALLHYNNIMNLWKINFEKIAKYQKDYHENLFDFLLFSIPTQPTSVCLFWYKQYQELVKKYANKITERQRVIIDLLHHIHHDAFINTQDIIKNQTNKVGNRNSLDSFNFNYYFCIGYFLESNTNKSLEYVNHLFHSMHKSVSYKQEGFIRIIELLSHYELGNFDFLDHLYRSVYRFLSKNKKASKTSLLLIKYFKKLYNARDKEEKKENLKEMNYLLENCSVQEMPWQTFERNVLLAWVKSQLNESIVIEDYRTLSNNK